MSEEQSPSTQPIPQPEESPTIQQPESQPPQGLPLQPETSPFKKPNKLIIASIVFIAIVILINIPIPSYVSGNKANCLLIDSCPKTGLSFGPSLVQRVLKLSPSGQSINKNSTTTPTPPSSQTPATENNQTANWKTYRNKKLGFSLKYPPEWQIIENEDYVVLIKDPDIRAVVGACPGYSFRVSSFDSDENYSYYLPVKSTEFKNKPADYSSKTNNYNCTTNAYFINNFPSEAKKPSLIITMTHRSENSSEIFNQILSTFEFIENESTINDFKRKSDIRHIQSALELYRADFKVYPQSLDTLAQEPKYLINVPKDPKTNAPYTYQLIGKLNYEVSTTLSDNTKLIVNAP